MADSESLGTPSWGDRRLFTLVAPEGAKGMSAFRRRRVLNQGRLFEGRLVRVTLILTLRSLHESREGRANLVDFFKLLH